jgi:hypothetical protein
VLGDGTQLTRRSGQLMRCFSAEKRSFQTQEEAIKLALKEHVIYETGQNRHRVAALRRRLSTSFGVPISNEKAAYIYQSLIEAARRLVFGFGNLSASCPSTSAVPDKRFVL